MLTDRPNAFLNITTLQYTTFFFQISINKCLNVLVWGRIVQIIKIMAFRIYRREHMQIFENLIAKREKSKSKNSAYFGVHKITRDNWNQKQFMKHKQL